MSWCSAAEKGKKRTVSCNLCEQLLSELPVLDQWFFQGNERILPDILSKLYVDSPSRVQPAVANRLGWDGKLAGTVKLEITDGRWHHSAVRVLQLVGAVSGPASSSVGTRYGPALRETSQRQ